MTISSENRKAGPYTGNGSTTAFPFAFKVFKAEDLQVVHFDPTTGVETTLALNTDYTVTLNADQNANPGGTVNTTSPVATGDLLTITSTLPLLQQTDLTNQGGFYPKVITDALDRLTIFVQQLAERVSRSLKIPISDGAVSTELPPAAKRAGTVLAFGNSGEPIVGPSIGAVGTVAGNITNVNTVASNITDVNTVAGDIGDVKIVAANITDVKKVAAIDSDVSAVAAIDSDVQIVAQHVQDVTNFSGVYYGASATDPVARRDGSALQDGDLYFNTGTGSLRVFSAAANIWVEGRSGTISTATFSGDGVTTVFNLPTAPQFENNAQVYITGVYQQKSEYTVSGTTLTFNTPPPIGTNNIEVVTIEVLPLGAADASMVVFQQGGTDAVVTNVQSKLRRIVHVTDFGVLGDGSNERAKLARAAQYAASVGATLDLCGLTITCDGGFTVNASGAKLIWRNGGVKLAAGPKTSAVVTATGIDTVDVQGVIFDGNRANVSGNNSSFFIIGGVRRVIFDVTVKDLLRYGFSIGVVGGGCDYVEINCIAQDIGLHSSGSAVSLGETFIVQDCTQVRIKNFKCTNPSGTGDGQVLKAFFCKNVIVEQLEIDNASPSKVYPAVSFVRNESIEYRNVKITGACQVAMENNANYFERYGNIVTDGTDKALIIGTDGAGRGNRRSENVVIENWVDTSTQNLAFNLIGVDGLTLRNVKTPKWINVSRDGISSDRRTNNLRLEAVTCDRLNTYLVTGFREYRNVTVATWDNQSPGVSYWVDSSFTTYMDSGVPNVFVARWNYENGPIHVDGTMSASGGTLVVKLPTTIASIPFTGKVFGSVYLPASPDNQWSQIEWSFYNNNIIKTVIQSGSTARSNVSLAVSNGNRTLTFTNEYVDVALRIKAVIQCVNSNAASVH